MLESMIQRQQLALSLLLEKRRLTEVAIDREERAIECEQDLYEFTRDAWANIPANGRGAFVDTKLMRVLCDLLMAFSRGELPLETLANLPPGTAKSVLFGVIWPAWDWLHYPTLPWLTTAHTKDLAARDSFRCRQLIASSWYQSNWGPGGVRGRSIALSPVAARTGRWMTTEGGVRLIGSVKSGVTGDRADRVLVDDPLPAKSAHSERDRKRAKEFISETIPSRVNDIESSQIFYVMQRIHRDDPSALLINDPERRKDILHVCLPWRYDPEHPYLSEYDWRTEKDELIQPERYSDKAAQKYEKRLTPKAQLAQLAQLPGADGGVILRDQDWLRWGVGEPPAFLTAEQRDQWAKGEPPAMDYIFASWDTAFSVQETNCLSAFTVWGTFMDRIGRRHSMMVGADRGQWSPDELIRTAAGLHDREKSHGISVSIIEAKANGIDLVRAMRDRGLMVQAITPTIDKVARAYAVQPYHAGQRVWVPSGLKWPQRVIDVCSAFPENERTEWDWVDSVTQAMQHLILIGGLGADKLADLEQENIDEARQQMLLAEAAEQSWMSG